MMANSSRGSAPAAFKTPAMVQVRLFVMMALQVAIWGAWAPKLFPYMTMLGFSAGQQALVGSSFAVASVIGLFFSNQFADRHFAAERFLGVNHALSGLCLIGVAFSTSFGAFFTFYLIYSLIYVPTLSVSNSIAFANLNQPALEFGRVRMGGTLGWIMVSWPFYFLLSVHATADQVRWIFLVAALLSFALSGFSFTLPSTPPRQDGAVDKFAWRESMRLLKRPYVAVLFIVTLIDAVVHNGYFVVTDAFLTDRVKIAGNISMIVMSLGQVAEMCAMLILGGVLVRLGWRVTMIIGVLGHAARFAVFALAADSLWAIVTVQFLHGICYAFFFAVVYIFVEDAFPKDVRTSAQGLFNLLILGIGMVIASFLFPFLVAHFTYFEAGADGLVAVVDYRSLFMVPIGLSMLGALLLAIGFWPASLRPEAGPSDHGTSKNDQGHGLGSPEMANV